MNETSSHEWQQVNVKLVKENTISVEAQGENFEIPKKIIPFDVHAGDTIYIRVTDEIGKKKNHSLLAKEILNTIFGDAEKKHNKENT